MFANRSDALLPGKLDHDVEPDQPEDDEQEQQEPLVREAGQRHRPEQRNCHVRPVISGHTAGA